MVTIKKSNIKKKLVLKEESKKAGSLSSGSKKKKFSAKESDEKEIRKEDTQTVDLTEEHTKKIQDLKDQGRPALNALKKHLGDRSGKSLFPDIDHAVGLVVTYKVPALVTNKARVKIELPCSPRTVSNTSVCLIMPDLDQSATARRDPDVDKQARKWAEKIEKDHGLLSQHYSKILTKRQLEREYHTFSQRRALATSYDLFLVDVRVGKAVRTFLGKEFYKVHKEPLDFNYSKPLVSSIEKAVNTVVLKVPRYATRAHISFGHLCQNSADLACNFDAVIDVIVNKCPGGLGNIRSVYMQPTGGSPSLPLYMDSGPASEIQLERPRKRRRAIEQVSDECSTLPDGLKLAVRKNGKIRVISEDTKVAVHYPTVHDEWDEKDTLKPIIDPAKLERRQALKRKRKQKQIARKKIMSGGKLKVQPKNQVKAE
ncbi:hypothetical protein RB195_012670 [Necator americanus]|uniref:Ribosomal L1p/L10e family protein n=1 Tax=Necator americanus TaxID=51031 RepID=A0ABR1DS12_NECAM